jgi:hypothetical protein
MARLYVLNRKYEEAIYHTYLLLKKDPESKYLKTIMAEALYGLSKYYNHGEYNEVHTSYEDIEGQSQQVYHFFEKIDKAELNVLAVQYLWELRKLYPADEEIDLMLKDSFKEMVYKHYPKISVFSSVKKGIAEPTVLEIMEDSTSKYAKIKKLKDAVLESDKDFIKYSMIGLLNDKETPKEKKARLTKERAMKDIQSRKGYALGLNKVVFVNPYYKRIDERKKNQVRYQVSEQVQLDFRKKLLSNAKLLNFDAEVLDQSGMKTNEILRFNENSLLNEWFSDKLKHDENIKLISPVHNQIQTLISKYGTSKFCWIGTISVTDNTSPRNKTLYYVLLYDVKNETLDMQSLNKIQQRDDNSILNSNIYYTLLQMKHKRKK